MTTESLPDGVLSTFGCPKAILGLLNSANENPQFGAQVDFLVASWNLAKAVKLSPKIKSSLGSLLEENKKKGVRFDDEQPWNAKVQRLKQMIEGNKRSKAAHSLQSFIDAVDIVGQAYGEEQKQRLTKLSEPVNSCSTKLSLLRVIVAFSKGEHEDAEQTSSLEQPTQHVNAVSSGCKRASEHPIEQRPRKQRLEGADDFAKPLQNDGMRQGHCTSGSGPLPREETYIPNETSPPNQKLLLSELEPEYTQLTYVGEDHIQGTGGTGDTLVKYRWGTRALIDIVKQDWCSFLRGDGEWFSIEMALDSLPFSPLAEIIKQSDTWKMENIESSEKTQCLKVMLHWPPQDPYCYFGCIVPRTLVSQCQQTYHMDFMRM